MPQIQASSSAATETSPASQQTPPPQEITQAVEAAKAARRFQDAADALKREAALARDPVERERLWQAAYLKEKEAHGESRKARCRSFFFFFFPSSFIFLIFLYFVAP